MEDVGQDNELKTSISHQETLKIKYKTSQWNPLNPDGKKVYSRDFLLQLQKIPLSLTKPLNLPNLDIIRDRALIQRLPKRIREEDKISQFEQDPRKLFIGGIPYTTLETVLEDHFGQFGEILECVIMRQFWDSSPRHFGFVIYKEPWMAEAAMQVEEHEVNGRLVEIKRAIPAEPRDNPTQNEECGDWRSKKHNESDRHRPEQEISKIENSKVTELLRVPSVESKFSE